MLAEHEGKLNLKNPACYVFPEANGCRPGDVFRADQLEQATAFAAYRPFDFVQPAGQQRAGWASLLTALGCAMLWLAWLVRWLRRSLRQE